MRLVVADTNGLLLPFQFRINLDAELLRLLGENEVVVPVRVVEELELLAKTDRAARAAARLAHRYRSIESRASGADDAVIDAALEKGGVVLTNDRALLGRLKELRVPRISLRSKSHLVLEGA